MNDRLVGMKRILKVQDQVKRIADWRVAEAERHLKREIEDAQQALAGLSGRNRPRRGTRGRGRRPDATAGPARNRTRPRASRTRPTRREKPTGRQKLVARFVDALAHDDRTARERKDLAALIEVFTNRAARPDPDAEPDHPLVRREREARARYGSLVDVGLHLLPLAARLEAKKLIDRHREPSSRGETRASSPRRATLSIPGSDFSTVPSCIFRNRVRCGALVQNLCRRPQRC